MVGEVCIELKKFSWTNLQSLRECKAFKAYGLFIVLHEQYFVENIWICYVSLNQ